MKKKIITVLLSAFLVIGFSSRLHAIEIYNFRDLELRLNKNNDTTYVIHFWATWCVPCLKEMPAFNEPGR